MQTTKSGWTILPKPKKGSPKLAKALRHEVKHLFHALHERVLLLREVDPSFTEELNKLGVAGALAKFERAVALDKRRRR